MAPALHRARIDFCQVDAAAHMHEDELAIRRCIAHHLLGLLMAASTMVVGGRTDEAFSGQTYFFFAPLFIIDSRRSFVRFALIAAATTALIMVVTRARGSRVKVW